MKLLFDDFDDFYKNVAEQTDPETIIESAHLRYAELCETESDRGNETVKKHLHKYILPSIAYFEAFVEAGIDRSDAKSLIKTYVHDCTKAPAKKLRRLGKLPFFYPLFRRMLWKITKSSYPSAGWIIEKELHTKEENAFEMRSCLYLDTFDAHGCPELTEIFCGCDEINYSNMSKKVSFLRTKTLAKGNECCDFRFVRNK